jgi:ubiquinone biosynthesis protein COQ4
MTAISIEQKIQYIHRPTRNPYIILRACWRVVRNLGATAEATILEEVFVRSRLMRRFAGWKAVAARHLPNSVTAADLRALPRLEAIDLDALLAECPEGSLGNVFANHMKSCGLNPNIFEPAVVNTSEDYLITHLIETHDIWHVASGFGNDEPGEAGVIAFSLAQTGAPIFALLLAIVLLNTALFSHSKTDERFCALVEGWQAGKRARQLFGVDWQAHWQRDIGELRRDLCLPEDVQAGVGIASYAESARAA